MTRRESEFNWRRARRSARSLAIGIAAVSVAATTIAEPLLAQQRMTTRSEQRKKVPNTRAALYSVFGAAAGSYMTLARLARCHPWCAGGPDPVPTEKRQLNFQLLTQLISSSIQKKSS